MNLAELLRRAAETHGERPAVSDGFGLHQNYRALAARAARLARALRERFGLRPGETVGIVMSNQPAYLEILFGCWQAGLAAVPVNAKLHAREIAWILDNAEARLCFVSAELAEAVAPLVAVLDRLSTVVVAASTEYERLFRFDGMAPERAVTPDTLAWLFYTSGTTGRPKGAMLSHRNLMRMIVNYFADVDQIGPGECIIHAAPLSHGSGLYGLPHLAKGANQVIPDSRGFDPAECLSLIGHYPGASFFFAPTMVQRLAVAATREKVATSNLKTIVYGGGPMYVADLLRAIEVFGPKFVQIYGQGEAPMTITGLPKWMHADTADPRYLERLGSAGPARTDVEVMVVGEDDRPLGVGEVGEVICRGDVVMQGYWRNPKASAETLRGGWLHTGDMGSFDAE
ncbi:MAG: AMP-binding protein, partial [Alphaproteobacteria bacterium]|nr:AMP-binding protein [Alphaproteobacteria bacterium]